MEGYEDDLDEGVDVDEMVQQQVFESDSDDLSNESFSESEDSYELAGALLQEDLIVSPGSSSFTNEQTRPGISGTCPSCNSLPYQELEDQEDYYNGEESITADQAIYGDDQYNYGDDGRGVRSLRIPEIEDFDLR